MPKRPELSGGSRAKGVDSSKDLVNKFKTGREIMSLHEAIEKRASVMHFYYASGSHESPSLKASARRSPGAVARLREARKKEPVVLVGSVDAQPFKKTRVPNRARLKAAKLIKKLNKFFDKSTNAWYKRVSPFLVDMMTMGTYTKAKSKKWAALRKKHGDEMIFGADGAFQFLKGFNRILNVHPRLEKGADKLKMAAGSVKIIRGEKVGRKWRYAYKGVKNDIVLEKKGSGRRVVPKAGGEIKLVRPERGAKAVPKAVVRPARPAVKPKDETKLVRPERKKPVVKLRTKTELIRPDRRKSVLKPEPRIVRDPDSVDGRSRRGKDLAPTGKPSKDLAPTGKPSKDLAPTGKPSKDLSPTGKPSKDLSPTGKPSKDLAPTGKPSKDLAPTGKPSKDLAPTGKPSKDLAPTGKPSKDLAPTGKPSKDLSPTGKPSKDLAPTGKPSKDLSPTGKPSKDLAPTGKPSKDLSPTGGRSKDLSPTGKPSKDLSPTGGRSKDLSPTGKPSKDLAPTGEAKNIAPTGKPNKDLSPTGKPSRNIAPTGRRGGELDPARRGGKGSEGRSKDIAPKANIDKADFAPDAMKGLFDALARSSLKGKYQLTHLTSAHEVVISKGSENVQISVVKGEFGAAHYLVKIAGDPSPRKFEFNAAEGFKTDEFVSYIEKEVIPASVAAAKPKEKLVITKALEKRTVGNLKTAIVRARNKLRRGGFGKDKELLKFAKGVSIEHEGNELFIKAKDGSIRMVSFGLNDEGEFVYFKSSKPTSHPVFKPGKKVPSPQLAKAFAEAVIVEFAKPITDKIARGKADVARKAAEQKRLGQKEAFRKSIDTSKKAAMVIWSRLASMKGQLMDLYPDLSLSPVVKAKDGVVVIESKEKNVSVHINAVSSTAVPGVVEYMLGGDFKDEPSVDAKDKDKVDALAAKIIRHFKDKATNKTEFAE